MPKETLPYVLASVAMSLDGFIDDGGQERLVLSNEQDFHERDKIRVEYDAILVGANTVRRDNPSLLLDNAELRQKRISLGLGPDLIKITVTRSGELNPKSRFFQTGGAEKIVYCPAELAPSLQAKLSGSASVVGLPDLTPTNILRDLSRKKVRSLIVEGGEKIHTAFLQENVVNELRVAIAPFLVGESGAPRFVGSGHFPFHKTNHLKLAGIEQLGNMAVLTYLLV